VRICPRGDRPTNIYRVVDAWADGEFEGGARPTSDEASDRQRADPSIGTGIRGALRGKRVLVTGVTGFLGQAVLERLLFDVPDVRPVVLIRSRGGQTPRSRLEELFARPCFARLREREGAEGIQRFLDERIEIVEGDVEGELPVLPGDLDVVFHCAASVLFDPPIDEAFRTNVLGAKALYEKVAAAGGRPHLVHVSTAYVAGVAKGIVPETPLEHDIDWREETEAAMGARTLVEAQSRKPELLDRFVARSRREHGRAGPKVVAEHAEERRREWVRKRLVHYGRARAQTLGWPDVYTLTKALGERAVEELAARHSLPLSIVRPSIVESALRVPHPGWIEGFKMAEPIILAYGRGAIPEFPGIPEGILDLIPVDLVVNAMLAVASRERETSAPEYFHVCSGSRNPLSFLWNYELVRDYFQRHPLPERGRGFYDVPVWRFPGRRRVEQKLRAGERLLDAADSVVSRLPRSRRIRAAVRNIDRFRGRLEFVRRYSDLYGAYVEAEVIYTDERTLELFRSLSPEDRREFVFDCAAIDWPHYLQEVHCPAVTLALRFPGPARAEPEVRIRPRENGVVLAVFDMEGTILASNVVESYLWLRLADLPRDGWAGEVASLAGSLPAYLSAERRDRGEFLRSFYRRYEGASVDGVRELVREQVAEMLLQRISPAAIRRIRQHRAAGHRTVLITGALEAFVEPLRPLFDEIVAAQLVSRDGRYTGFLSSPPLVGEARAAWLKRYAGREGADLSLSYAYADSHTDLPLLRTVGNPVAVNPDVSLVRVARRRRWPVEEWEHSRGTPRVLVPEAVPS
jgi:HAD superfamily hydrolase (TIGR01490 family)